MKVIKGILAGASVLLILYVVFVKTILFICLTFGLFAYAGFSYWMFNGLYGRYIWVFKTLLFLIIMFIFIGGFYLHWEIAGAFAGWLLAWLVILLPFFMLFLAYKEKKLNGKAA
ncbi:MAG TPA: hypothetical protein PLM81_00400 [Ginsengibacter sp.]|nr:hypothetical protein [Ginsengibacter sp.]